MVEGSGTTYIPVPSASLLCTGCRRDQQFQLVPAALRERKGTAHYHMDPLIKLFHSLLKLFHSLLKPFLQGGPDGTDRDNALTPYVCVLLCLEELGGSANETLSALAVADAASSNPLQQNVGVPGVCVCGEGGRSVSVLPFK